MIALLFWLGFGLFCIFASEFYSNNNFNDDWNFWDSIMLISAVMCLVSIVKLAYGG